MESSLSSETGSRETHHTPILLVAATVAGSLQTRTRQCMHLQQATEAPGFGVALLYAYFFKAPSRVELWAVSLLLFGIVFLITGVYILFGPWLQRLVRRRTFYAVTDRRVIIVNERPWHRVVALDLERLVSARVLLE